jgi:hypothetical protein
MNLQSVVVVLLRLSSLNFLVSLLLQVPYVATYISRSASYGSSSGLVWISLFLVVGLICAALIWVMAPAISRLMTRGLSQEVPLGALSLTDCYSVAFVGIGLFLAAGHLSQVLYWLFYSLHAASTMPEDSWKTTLNGYSISQAVISFIIGIVLLVNGRKWAVALSQRDSRAGQAASQEQKDNYPV